MTEPTPLEIERVAVAISDAEMKAHGMSDEARIIAAEFCRDVSVETYGVQAKAAIIAIRHLDVEKAA